MDYKRVLMLRFTNGMSSREIAETTGDGKTTVLGGWDQDLVPSDQNSDGPENVHYVYEPVRAVRMGQVPER